MPKAVKYKAQKKRQGRDEGGLSDIGLRARGRKFADD